MTVWECGMCADQGKHTEFDTEADMERHFEESHNVPHPAGAVYKRPKWAKKALAKRERQE